MTSNNYKIAYSAVTGQSHLDNDLVCQDKTMGINTHSYVAISLADGAGSCSNSDIGANEINKFIIKELTSNFFKYYNKSNQVKKLTLKVERAVSNIAKDYNVSVESLSSTLLFVVINIKTNQFIAGHIGDGVIGYLDNQDAIHVLSKPINGEYDNITWFTTSSYKTDRLRLYCDDIKNHNGFILMSDGIEDSLYSKNTNTLVPITSKIIQLLDLASQEEVSNKLTEQLNGVFKSNSDDDLSIAILRKTTTTNNQHKTIKKLQGVSDETAGLLFKRKKYCSKRFRRSICKQFSLQYEDLGKRSKKVFKLNRK